VTTEELINLLGVTSPRPALPDHLKAWIEAEDRHIEAVLPPAKS
jgi:hypothetical protein